MTTYQGQTLRKGHCPKCRQRGTFKHVTHLHTHPVKYYKCSNPKCKLTWSETP